MDVLGGISVVSSGLRLARGLVQKAQSSGKPFSVESGETPGTQLISQHDSDGDGKLSIDELGASNKIFEGFDRDGDGFLTATEINEGILEARGNDQMERAIARYMELHDSDLDSLISIPESGFDSDEFIIADRNNDAFLNHGELTSAYRQQTLDITA